MTNVKIMENDEKIDDASITRKGLHRGCLSESTWRRVKTIKKKVQMKIILMCLRAACE